MRKRGLLRLIWLALLSLALTTGFVGLSMPVTLAQGPPPRPSPPPQPPSPPPNRPTPPPIGPGPGVGGRGAPEGAPSFPCSTVHGFVLNWGYRNEPKLPIDLRGDGWQTQKVTDDNGYYASECLGIGVGLLNPVSPPGLHPLTTDVAIRLGYQADFEVNLGLYGGDVAPALDVTPSMTVSSDSASPGETLTYTIKVVNMPGSLTAGHTMGGVMITDLLPESLTPVEVSSTVGITELWGNLLTADIGELAPGQAVTITLMTAVRQDTLAGTAVTNQASLIYAGHVAVQTVPIITQVGTPSHLGADAAGDKALGGEIKPPAVLPVTGAGRSSTSRLSEAAFH